MLNLKNMRWSWNKGCIYTQIFYTLIHLLTNKHMCPLVVILGGSMWSLHTCIVGWEKTAVCHSLSTPHFFSGIQPKAFPATREFQFKPGKAQQAITKSSISHQPHQHRQQRHNVWNKQRLQRQHSRWQRWRNVTVTVTSGCFQLYKPLPHTSQNECVK